jgi:hypothetical protein
VVDATPYGKDLIAPLAEACHKHGMKFGFYYSQAQDWTHPGGGAYKNKWDDAQKGDFAKYINEIAIPQTREILSNYGKIDIIWWDTPANMTPELAEPLFKLAHELQPGIIMNDRLGGNFHGDSATPEQHIPSTGYADGRDWEVCMTLNNTWGYSEHDQNWKSPERVIKNLVDIASKGCKFISSTWGPRLMAVFPKRLWNVLVRLAIGCTLTERAFTILRQVLSRNCPGAAARNAWSPMACVFICMSLIGPKMELCYCPGFVMKFSALICYGNPSRSALKSTNQGYGLKCPEELPETWKDRRLFH